MYLLFFLCYINKEILKLLKYINIMYINIWLNKKNYIFIYINIFFLLFIFIFFECKLIIFFSFMINNEKSQILFFNII